MCKLCTPGMSGADRGEREPLAGERYFDIQRFHTGKYEATYRVAARSYEEAAEFVEEHRLELEPIHVFPLSDDYELYL